MNLNRPRKSLKPALFKKVQHKLQYSHSLILRTSYKGLYKIFLETFRKFRSAYIDFLLGLTDRLVKIGISRKLKKSVLSVDLWDLVECQSRWEELKKIEKNFDGPLFEKKKIIFKPKMGLKIWV